MDSESLWALFSETGEPMAYLLYAAARQQEFTEAEDQILPSA